MDAPKVDEAMKEQLRKEYADFDVEALLENQTDAGEEEVKK